MNIRTPLFVSAVASLLLVAAPGISFAVGIRTIDGLSAADQFLVTTTSATTMHMNIVSAGTTHTFQWNGTPWAVAQGGTGATSFTNGSVLFFSGSSFSQDNANFFWDSANHFLGIGNVSPHHALDVAGAMYSRLVLLASGTISIDWNAGNVQSLTLTSNTTLSFANGQRGGEYKLILKQDGMGGRTVIWPADVQWPSGIVPTLTSSANSKDVISFVKDGNDFYLGSVSLNYSTPPSRRNVSALVVAGGGGGGDATGGGGGGGGVIFDASHAVAVGSYPITIGNGGSGGTSQNDNATNGGNSVFDTLTAIGGGAGAVNAGPGHSGGSGGGAGNGNGVPISGGSGVPGQGHNGGSTDANLHCAAGGGGASAAGNDCVTDGIGANGGDGVANSISGASVVYAGGGGGGSFFGSDGVGGTGGGAGNGTVGTPNTGGGGGGSHNNNTSGAGAGGSGIVIISYPMGSITATGGTISTSGGNTIHTFTSSGTFTVTAIN